MVFKRNEKLDFSWEKKKRKMYHILLYDIKKEMYQESEGNERCVKLERDVLVELFTRQTAMIISAKRVETRFEMARGSSPLIIETY